MADRHRGPDPADEQLRDPGVLREAVADLSWLRGRAYAEVAALKLVGDKYQLTRRQRTAVARSACSDAALRRRRSHRVDAIEGSDVAVDGFNLLITLERGLSGGPVLRGRDGAHRDLAGLHGTWRAVAETDRALDLAAGCLDAAASVTWLLDQPVSNSGRLAARLRERGWQAEVVPSPDPLLADWPGVVITSDGWILDRCAGWFDLAGAVLADAWIVDLRPPADLR